jgi:excisionase family DNA binding protein
MMSLECLRSLAAALRAAAEVLERDAKSAEANAHPKGATESTPLATDWIQDVVIGLPMLVTTSEAAKALRMSARNVSRLLARRQLQAVRTGIGGGSRVLIARGEIARFLRRLEV